MDWSHIERNWETLKQSIKTRWAKVSDSDLNHTSGDRDEFVSVIQNTYGYDREQALSEVYAWQGSQDGLDNNNAPDEEGAGVYDNRFGYQETPPQQRAREEHPDAAIARKKSFEQSAASGKGIQGTITLPHHDRAPGGVGVRNASGENKVRSEQPSVTEDMVLRTSTGERHKDPENNKHDIRGPGGIPVNNDDFQNDEGHEEDKLPIPNPLPDDMLIKNQPSAQKTLHVAKKHTLKDDDNS